MKTNTLENTSEFKKSPLFIRKSWTFFDELKEENPLVYDRWTRGFNSIGEVINLAVIDGKICFD